MLQFRSSGGGGASVAQPAAAVRPKQAEGGSRTARARRRTGRRRLITGLDVGTTKVCTVIAEAHPDGAISILGLGSHPSRGVRRGRVTDIDHTASAIEKSFLMAHELARVVPREVYVGIAGDHISGFDVEGMVEVADPSVGIDDRDCRKAMDRALKFNMPPDVEILHHVVREFIVNGERQIVNPRGLFGGQLEVRAHVITGAISAGNNLSRCVKKAGLKTTSIVLESLASALSTLGDRERELGVVLIDIGGGTTDIAVFGEGSLQYIAEIASGGDTLTHDVQTVLRCAPQDAEHLKKKFGHANPLAVDPEERIDLRGPAKGGGCVQYPRRELARILEARVEEILFAVKKVIQRSGFANRIYGGAVLTGGTALLEGIAAVAERILDQPTRIGMPRGLRGMGELVSSPIYSTGVGLIHWAAEEGPGYRPDPWLIRKFKEVFDLYG